MFVLPSYGILRSLLIVLLLVGVGSCQTDWEQLEIGEREQIVLPEGLFPPEDGEPTIGRGYATTQLSANFGKETGKLAGDPALTFKMLALFEWLVNDIRHWSENRMPPYKIRELIDVKDDLRDMLNIPRSLTANDAIRRLYSMSKFMKAVHGGAKATDSEPKEISARRELLKEYKGKITNIMKRLSRKETKTPEAKND